MDTNQPDYQRVAKDKDSFHELIDLAYPQITQIAPIETNSRVCVICGYGT